jgi:hypothetical protein
MVLAALGILVIGVLAFVAYGGVGSSGGGRGGLSAWVHGTGLGQSLGTLHADNGHVTLVLHRHLGNQALHTVCAVLSDDTATAMADLPSPNSTLNTLLARAYQAEYQAANDCYSAGANGSRDHQAEKEVAAGQTLLDQAVALAVSATGATLSTTTTTTPDSGGIFG